MLRGSLFLLFMFFEVLLETISDGFALKSPQSRGALQRWLVGPALAALVWLGV